MHTVACKSGRVAGLGAATACLYGSALSSAHAGGIICNERPEVVKLYSPLLAIVVLAVCAHAPASAIVVRHDVIDERYQAHASDIPQLADMPNVGHGVLIAPRWVVTAAHTVQGEVHSVTIGGVSRKVDHVEVHPGYRSVPSDIVQRALENGRALEINQFLAGTDDIALIRLSQPVTDVDPIRIYSGNSEVGRTAQLFGKGATGTGLSGVVQGSPQRGVLRKAFNRIDAADGRWIVYTFEDGRRAHRLEGMGGSGDSGGPVLIRVRGHWTLAGLISWKGGDVDVRQPGSRYGQPAYNVRLSHYVEWIQGIVSRGGDRIVLRR